MSANPEKRRRRDGPSIKDIAPAWLQAVAAIAGVVLTALVVFGISQDRNSPSASSPPGASPAPVPVVTLESVTIGDDTVEATGTYAGIDESRQSVLFIGRPVDAPTAAIWVPVEAELARETTVAAPSSGRWHATRPGVPEGRWQWFALIGPDAQSAADAYEELRRNGPNSSLVIALSEPATTE